MKNFISLSFAVFILAMMPSCSLNKGLTGLSPTKALSAVQTLLGGASSNALSGFTGNILGNAAMKAVLPSGLSSVTNLLGASPAGSKALGLLNGALASSVKDIVPSILSKATSNIPAADALGLLQGGNTGATDFLKKAAGAKLQAALLPAITQKLTANGGLGAITSALGGQAANLLGGNKPSIADLATSGAVDGLFAMMGNAEKAERANPTDPMLKKLFGK